MKIATIQLKIAFTNYGYPYKSLTVVPCLDRFYDPVTGTSKYNSFPSTFHNFTKHRLRAPYHTDCIDYPKDRGLASRAECMQKCVSKYCQENLGKIPFSVIQTVPVSMNHVSYHDIKNETISDSLHHYEDLCNGECSNKDCKSGTVFTVTKPRYTAHDDSKNLGFNALIPDSPSIHVIFEPRMKLVEYLTFVCSTVSTWFGVSILMMDPFMMVVKRKLKRDRLARDGKVHPKNFRDVIEMVKGENKNRVEQVLKIFRTKESVTTARSQDTNNNCDPTKNVGAT